MTDKIKPFVYDELKLPKMLTFMGVVLRRRCVTIFRMGNRLVYVLRWERPSSDTDDDTLRRDDNALMVETVTNIKLHEFAVEFVPFGQLLVGKNGAPPTIKRIAPPKTLSLQFMEARDRWRFNVLAGLIQTPTLRKDGTLLDKPGWDKESGLYLDTNGVDFPAIKDKPTRADALKALAFLKEPFKEFPFDTMTTDNFEQACPSLSVALSGILTGLIRRTLRAAPLHLFDAPEAGSGKGLLCSVITNIVTGQNATAITLGSEENDVKKLLFTALIENHSVIVFDNLTRALGGPSLCSAMTEETLTDRILGVTKSATVPTNALFLASGNNIEVAGDMHRRVIGARIEPGENPEERTFERPDLIAWVKENRPALVAAGLTVLRAYQVAGFPKADIPAFGSFEEWSDRVRSALVWLGEADPCMTRARFKEQEPEREALADVLRVLADITGPKFMLAHDIIADANHQTGLQDALSLAGIGLEAVSVGKYLGKNKGRTINGIRLDQGHDGKRKIATYKATKVG